MTRTFTVLAGIVMLLLLATIGVGLWHFVTEDRARRDEIFVIHFALGLCAALGVLLVHCIIFTYFLGTGRWVKEVTLAYRLPDAPWHKTTRELKRATFPPALFAMLIAIATAAAGAGAQLQAWHWSIHATLAFVTVLVNLWAFCVEHRNVTTNAGIILDVLAEVDRRRAAEGLPSNEAALAEEEAMDARPR
jgi:amino acid transporter